MTQASDVVYLPILPSMRGFGPAVVKQGAAGAAAGGKTLGATLGRGMVLGMAAGAVAVGGFAAYGLKEFAKFEKGMNEVFTLLPGISEDAMGKMNDDTRKFVREMGIAHDEAVPALYSAISAGIPQKNVFDFMEVAAQASIGGVTDMETAVDGLTSVMNAYGQENMSASEASDLMFTAVKLGKTDFEQLSGSLYNVLPTASALGVEFGDVTAAMASMTAQGTPTSVATTQLRQMMVELSKDGGDMANTFKDISGKTFKEFIAEGGNTQEALELLSEHAKESGVGINDLFGSVEAGSAALSLSGDNADAYAENIEAMGDSAGATAAAYEGMDQGITRTMERIGIQFKDAAIEVGENLAPTAQRFADFLQDHLPGAIATASSAVETVYDVVSDLADVIFNRVLPALRDFGDYAKNTMVPALKDFWGWLNENKRTIGIVAGVITAIMLPALVRLGISALINGGKAVAGWVMQQVAAVKAGVAYVVQSIRIIGTWIAMGAAAVASGATTAYVWLLYRLEAIKAAGVMIAQRALIVGAWIAMSAAAVASGARTALVWAVQVVGAAARGAARFVLSAARVVGGWVLMSLQSLLHAGRMAAAWFIALGPIGWVTAAVIAIAALVIANWDKISKWTKKAWSAVMNWIVGAWQNIRTRTMQILAFVVSWITGRFNALRALTAAVWGAIRDRIVNMWTSIRDRISSILGGIVTWIKGRFTSIRDTTYSIWNAVRDKISSIWTGIRDKIKSVWNDGIKPVFQAFGNFIKDTVVERIKTGIDMIKSAWEKVANIFRKPINWVINTVWNGGIKKAFDAVSKAVGSDTRLAEVKSIPAFAKGGDMQDGWKLVGEKGPELINTGPGWVARADQTKRLLNGDVKEGEHVHPMGGNWVSKAWDSVKDAASSALSWVRGGLASAAESLLKPLISSATGQMAKFGSMGALGGGLIDNGVDRLLEWVRGEDTVESSGGHEYDGPMQMGGAYRPGRGPITSWYGMRGGRLHGGVDIAGPRGAPTFAAWDGVVHSIQNYAQGSGLSVNLSHGGGKYSHYGHNDYGGIPVRAGQSVKAGQRIGNMGMTGRTTGPHVHFETWQGGLWNRRNPNSLFRDTGGPIYPGLNMVRNDTGKLERTFNDPQFQNLNRMAELAVNGGGKGAGEIHYHAHSAGSQYQDANDFRRTMRRLERVGH